MSLRHLYTATLRTGRIPVSLDCYEETKPPASWPTDPIWGERAVSQAVGTPTVLRTERGSRLPCLDPRAGYGSPVRASGADLVLIDDDGSLRTRFRRLTDERRYLWRIAWPAHATPSGEPVPAGIWYGRPMAGETPASLSPRLYPSNAVKLRLWDGLAALADVPGQALQSYATLRAWLTETVGRVSRHLPIVWGPDVYPAGLPTGTSTRDPSALRFIEELRGAARAAERGDFGSQFDQLARVCEGLGLVCVQQTDPAVAEQVGDPSSVHTPGPAIWIVHRSVLALGTTGGPSALRLARGIGRGVALSPSRVTLAEIDWQAERTGADEVPGVRSIKMTGEGQVNLLSPDWPAGQPLFAGQQDDRAVGSIADPTVRLRLGFGHEGIGGAFSGYRRAGYVQVRAEGRDGTRYLRRDGTWSATPSAETQLRAPDGPGLRVFPVGVTSEPIEITARVFVRAVGGTATQGGSVTGLVVRSAFLTPLNADGEPLSEWVAYDDGLPSGEAVTLRRLPAVQVLQGSEWGPPTAWRSGRLGDFLSLQDYQGRDRLAQQARPLGAPLAKVYALLGLGTTVTLPGSALYTDAPVACVPGGGMDLHLDAAETRGAWTELTLDAMEATP